MDSNTIVQHIINYCHSLKGTNHDFPFGPNPMVFRVGGKMFCLLSMDDPISMNLKCDPVYALALREKHAAITPGYHMNKKHWNTVQLDGTLDAAFLEELIRDSYDLIVMSLPRAKREGLDAG